MSEEQREITDGDREEILRLVLSEAEGMDVAGALSRYPRAIRSKFRQVVCEAGLVKGGLARPVNGESAFGAGAALTDRGRRRLKELNARRDRIGK
jgi:hypothetical protein